MLRGARRRDRYLIDEIHAPDALEGGEHVRRVHVATERPSWLPWARGAGVKAAKERVLRARGDDLLVGVLIQINRGRDLYRDIRRPGDVEARRQELPILEEFF